MVWSLCCLHRRRRRIRSGKRPTWPLGGLLLLFALPLPPPPFLTTSPIGPMCHRVVHVRQKHVHIDTLLCSSKKHFCRAEPLSLYCHPVCIQFLSLSLRIMASLCVLPRQKEQKEKERGSKIYFFARQNRSRAEQAGISSQ